MAEGAFPNLEKPSLLVDDYVDYLEQFIAALEQGAPCYATLRRVDLHVTRVDFVHLPRLAQALAGLPQLEHVELGGSFYGDDGKVHWDVAGGRDVLLELTRVLPVLEGDGANQEELTTSIERVLAESSRREMTLGGLLESSLQFKHKAQWETA
jgi:hypothetical protein